MARDLAADKLKGYACLLVLFGHVVVGLASSAVGAPEIIQKIQALVYTFHMDLWMFLAGYVYSLTGGWKRSGTRWRFLGKKAVNLGVPYLAFSVLYIATNALTPGVNTETDLSTLLFLYKTPIAQYWFLYALFFVFVLWTLLSRFFNNPMITLVLYFAFVFLSKVCHFSLGIFDTPMAFVLPFGLGTCIRSLSLHKTPLAVKITVLVVHFASVMALVYTDWLATVPCLDDFVAVFGILASVFLISLVSKLRFAAAFLDLTNRYSLPIYLLHTIFTAAVRIVLVKLGVTNFWLHLVLGLVVGWTASVLIAKLAEKVWVFGFFFYPLKTLNERRAKKKTA